MKENQWFVIKNGIMYLKPVSTQFQGYSISSNGIKPLMCFEFLPGLSGAAIYTQEEAHKTLIFLLESGQIPDTGEIDILPLDSDIEATSN